MRGKPHILSFSPTSLINSIKHEQSCKILYIQQFKHALGALKEPSHWNGSLEYRFWLRNFNDHHLFVCLCPSQHFFSHVKQWAEQVYTASKVKHHMNIISKMVFIYDFLQKNNQFVIYCYPSLSLDCQTYQNIGITHCFSCITFAGS